MLLWLMMPRCILSSTVRVTLQVTREIVSSAVQEARLRGWLRRAGMIERVALTGGLRNEGTIRRVAAIGDGGRRA